MSGPPPSSSANDAAAKGRSGLQVLVAQGQKAALEKLLASPSPATRQLVNHADNAGRRLLHDLAAAGWDDLVPAALAAGADLSLEDKEGRLPLHLAAIGGHDAVIRVLCRHGTPPDARVAGHKGTALHLAAQHGHAETLRLLLALGASPAAKNPDGDESGMNAYHYAAMSSPEIMGILLAHHDAAHLHARCAWHKTEADAFCLALHAGNVPVVEQLIDYGVAVNGRDGDQQTPLQWLLLHKDTRDKALPMIRLLQSRGADGDKALNLWGETPLMVAAKADFPEAVALLLDQGADATRRSYFDDTALHFAAQHYTVETVRLLLAAGAEVNAQDRNGQTPLHLAAQRNRRDVVKALLAADADPLIADRQGRTPDALCQAPVQQVTRHLVLERQKIKRKNAPLRGRFNRQSKGFRFQPQKKPASKRFGNRP